MKNLMLVIAVTLLCGCATTIHLVTKGYSEQEISTFSKQLTDKGFDVEYSSIVIPKSYPSAVIAVNPDINPDAAMPPYLASVGCKTGYTTLAFQADKTLLLETEVPFKGRYKLQFDKDVWSFDGSILTITMENNEAAQFSQRKIVRNTALGKKSGLLYTPTTTNHLTKPLKCAFEVIFVN